MRPDVVAGGRSITETLEAVRRRVLVRDIFRAIAVGCVLAILIALALPRPTTLTRGVATIVSLGSAVAAMLLVRRRARSRAMAARIVEAAYPLHNVVITAEELQRRPGSPADWLRDRVFTDAARRLQAVDRSRVVPLQTPAALAAVLVALLVVSHVVTARSRIAGPTDVNSDGVAIAGTRLEIALVPPAYSGLPRQSLENPLHLEVLEGTRAEITLTTAVSAEVRIGERQLPVSRVNGRAHASVDLTESTYLAFDLPDQQEPRDRRVLIPVTVTPDALPSIRIEAPGRDLLLPAARSAIGVVATATDDLALRDMSLKYTKVSGSGEQFEFVEGELPLHIARDDHRVWKAKGEIPLARLGLGPGDSLVYRVTAHDTRPGEAGAGSSDTFFVEIAGPGQVALEGLDMPQERDRYALSQQMVVLKIERLRAREPKLSAATLQDEASAIAGEQRAVRANLVFLMGGHVEDEEQEAEQSHEIQEGRLENTAWRDMSRAVGHMTHAEQSLIAVNTGAALSAARLAVEALQRAFGRSRYFVRTVPTRSRIDPSRRLSGLLDDVRGTDRAASTGIPDAHADLTRALLADALTIASSLHRGTGRERVADALTGLAERALTVRAGDDVQRLAQDIVRAREAAVQNPAGPEVRDRVDRLVQVLMARARASAATATATGTGEDRLRGVWAEEARRR